MIIIILILILIICSCCYFSLEPFASPGLTGYNEDMRPEYKEVYPAPLRLIHQDQLRNLLFESRYPAILRQRYCVRPDDDRSSIFISYNE